MKKIFALVLALALAAVLPALAQASPRINAVDDAPVVTQLGRDESGRYVWQVTFDVHCRISD